MNTKIGRLAAAGAASLAVAGALIAAALPAAAATEGTQHCAVNLQTGQTGCAATDAQAARLADVSAASVLAVTLYDGTNYTGAKASYYVANPCTAPYEGEYGVGDLGSFSN